jgi:hypothetical protein
MKQPREELVRIDNRGEAHPIGRVASERMRQREGAFRMLPAPDHVVLMRYTGEDGRRDEGDGAVVRLAGEITSAGSMCEILGLLAQTGWKGEIVVFDEHDRRSLFFDQGNVVGAETTADAERLGAVMYRFGGISEEQLQELTKKPLEGQRLGNAAVELGYVTQQQVFRYLRNQIEEIVHSTLIADDGTFFFLDGYDDSRLVSRQVVSANALLMDAVTRLDEIRYFREKIPSADHVPERNPQNTEPPPDEYSKTYECIDGQHSILELGRMSGRGEFDTTRDIYALMRTKHVLLAPPALSGGLSAIVSLANDALLRIHRFVDADGTGVELRQRLESFASGAGLYDLLLRGAGPDGSGALDVERVADNVALVAHGQKPELVLRQMLHEYVGFGLFSAGSTLSAAREKELKAEVGSIVSRLQPPA